MSRYGKAFRIQQLIVNTCWEKNQPWFGEIKMIQAMQGYVKNGTGFSHLPAGMSNICMFRSGSLEDAYWATRDIAREQNIINVLQNESRDQEQRCRQAQEDAAIQASSTLQRMERRIQGLSEILGSLRMNVNTIPKRQDEE